MPDHRIRGFASVLELITTSARGAGFDQKYAFQRRPLVKIAWGGGQWRLRNKMGYNTYNIVCTISLHTHKKNNIGETKHMTKFCQADFCGQMVNTDTTTVTGQHISHLDDLVDLIDLQEYGFW